MAGGWLIALLVGTSRVVLGYHSLQQVVVGAVAGVATAGAWFAVLVWIVRPMWGGCVQQGGVMGIVLTKVLCVRDTLDVGGDVVCVERDLLVGVAALGKKAQ